MKLSIYKAGVIRFLAGALFLVASLASCKKEDYRTDGGLASANTNLTTYDYLAANSYKNFDTLLLIVDHFNLKDSVNKAGTFFAPTDYAILRLMNANNLTTLDDLYKKINSKFLTQYMFSDTGLTLNQAATTVKTYKNWAGNTVGLSKIAASYGVATTSLTYYMLQYVKINGVLDGTPGAPSDDEADAVLRCQTTGIKTASGTNLNVFANTVLLNLVGDVLPTELTLSYDVNVTQSATDYTTTPVQLESDKIAGFFGLTAANLSTMLTSGNASTKYYALEPNGNLSANYTATPPGFWFDASGYVVNWGNTAYLFAELAAANYTLTVGQYPGHAKVGDKYTLKQVFAYTTPDAKVLKVIIKVNVTLV